MKDRCGRTGKHDLLPTLPSCRAKEQEQRLKENNLIADNCCLQSPEGMSGNCCACVLRSPLVVQSSQRPDQKEELRFQITKMFLTCIPTTPYMKKIMAMKAATQGRAWKDLTKVKSRVRIPSPLETSLTTRRTRKRRKKETDIMFPGWREVYIDRLFESSPEVDSCRCPEETQ